MIKTFYSRSENTALCACVLGWFRFLGLTRLAARSTEVNIKLRAPRVFPQSHTLSGRLYKAEGDAVGGAADIASVFRQGAPLRGFDAVDHPRSARFSTKSYT